MSESVSQDYSVMFVPLLLKPNQLSVGRLAASGVVVAAVMPNPCHDSFLGGHSAKVHLF